MAIADVDSNSLGGFVLIDDDDDYYYYYWGQPNSRGGNVLFHRGFLKIYAQFHRENFTKFHGFHGNVHFHRRRPISANVSRSP